MMRKSLWASSFLAVFMLGVLASANGCGPDGKCDEFYCEDGTQLYACKPDTGLWKYECQAGETAANFWCQSIAGKPAVYMACDEYNDEYGDTDESGDPPSSWDPSSNVSVNPTNGHYEVDSSLVATLKDDPGLILLDSARVNLNTAGNLVLQDVVRGDLAAALGLQSGDVLVSVNGHSLNTLDDLAAAYSALKTATTFTLTIVRNRSTMQLAYDVV